MKTEIWKFSNLERFFLLLAKMKWIDIIIKANKKIEKKKRIK